MAATAVMLTTGTQLEPCANGCRYSLSGGLLSPGTAAAATLGPRLPTPLEQKALDDALARIVVKAKVWTAPPLFSCKHACMIVGIRMLAAERKVAD